MKEIACLHGNTVNHHNALKTRMALRRRDGGVLHVEKRMDGV